MSMTTEVQYLEDEVHRLQELLRKKDEVIDDLNDRLERASDLLDDKDLIIDGLREELDNWIDTYHGHYW